MNKKLKITDRERVETIIKWAKNSNEVKVIWTWNLLSRRNIDTAIRSDKFTKRKRP